MPRRLSWHFFLDRNVDQEKIRRSDREKWNTDPRVGDSQLDNDYYRNNDWDRGHLVQRASASWGDTDRAAQQASDDTMFYTNCALQHENLNQDEWLALEDWVNFLEDDSTNKISVFSGPIYGDAAAGARFVRPNRGGGEAAEVPAAFFKVVVFIDKSRRLAVRAFVMVQDRLALSDKSGARSRMFDLQAYQVTVTMIMRETGLVFPEEVVQANPLFFNPGPEAERVGKCSAPTVVGCPVNC